MNHAMTAARSVAAGARRGWWWMTAVALLAALGSATLGSGALPTTGSTAVAQQASAVVEIASSGVTAQPDVDEVVSTMRAALATAPVRADIARRSGGADIERLAISVGSAGSDRIAVTVASPDDDVAPVVATAAREAGIAAVAVDHRITRDASVASLRDELGKADDALAASQRGSIDQEVLQAQRDTLVRAVATVAADPGPVLVAGTDPVLSAPAPAPTFAVPAPVLTFLLVVAVLVLGVPLVRVARGRLPETDPAAWISRQLGVPVVELSGRSSPMLDLAEVYRSHLRDIPRITVVQLTRPAACDLGAELVRTAALNGDDRTHDDRTPGSRRIPDGRPDAPVVRTLRTPRVDRDTARALLDSGPTVVVVQTATAQRAGLLRDVSLLRGIGADVVAVVVWTGRIPVDPARPWTPPAGDPDSATATTTVDPSLRIPQEIEPRPEQGPERRRSPSPVPRERSPQPTRTTDTSA